MFNAARAIGPALAGVLVATTGEANAFFINGLSFIAVIISLLMMRGLPKPIPRTDNENPIQHMTGGVRFILQRQTILILISLIAVSAFLSMPYNTLLPVFASDVLQQSASPVIAALCSAGGFFSGC